LDEQYFGNHKETITEGLESLKIDDHEETITEGLENLNIVPDDWEDSLITTGGKNLTQERLCLSDKEKDRTKPNLYDCPRCDLKAMTYGDILRDHLDNVRSQDINEIKDMTTCTRPLCLQGPGCNGKGEKFKLGGNGIRKRNSKMDSASFIPLIEADRGNRISPSVWHTTAIDTPGATASCTPRARQGGGNGSGGGRYGGARQGGGGRGDRQGGGGSGRYGDDRGGRSVLGMRSGKEREAKVFDHHFSASSRAFSGLWNCTLCSKGSMDESAAEVHMNCAGHRSKMETSSHFGDESSTKVVEDESIIKAVGNEWRCRPCGTGAMSKKDAIIHASFCLAPNARIEKKKREEEEKKLAEQKCAEKAIKLAEQKCAEEAAAKKIIEEAEAVQRQRRLLKVRATYSANLSMVENLAKS
jgi:hypothetical protein